MNIGLLPEEHMHTLVNEQKPAFHYASGDLKAWQTEAREKLAELIGFGEIEKFACPLECEIEYDRYAEDLDCREIRIRLATEENEDRLLYILFIFKKVHICTIVIRY